MLGVQLVESQTVRELRQLSKRDLHHLADQVKLKDNAAIAKAISFICIESEGVWHGRARAMLCRRLKHIELSRSERAPLLKVILDRLLTGQFSEQFKDQLRLALHLDSLKTQAVAMRGIDSNLDHVRRYSEWVLSREKNRDA